METWKDVIGFEGLYSVSDYGRIKAHRREYYSGKLKKTKKVTAERIIPLGNQTYLGAMLCKDGKAKREASHRLVALHFIPNPENKPCVNHIDGDKHNNHFSNLEWVTHKENSTHAKIHLDAFKDNRGRVQKSMRKIIQYDLQMNKIKEYRCISDAARENNLFVQNIGFACKHTDNKIGGFYWRFA